MPELVAIFKPGFGISARKLVVESREKKRMARNIQTRISIFLLNTAS
jgi:hypothetical protein